MLRNVKVLALMLAAALLIPGLMAQQQPANATNSQDERVNLNVGLGDEEELAGSLTIIRTDDVNAYNEYVSHMYQLSTQGLEIQPHLRLLVEQEGGRVRPWVYVDPETGEHDNWVQVVCPAYQVPYVEEIIETMNRPGTASIPGGTRLHYRMHNQLASHVADIIRRTEVTGDGFVEADDVTNTIFIFDSESDARRDLAAAQFYDVPGRMVELGVNILEIDTTDTETLGLDWDAWKTSAAGIIQISSASRDSLGGEFFSFDTLLGLDATTVAEFLNYLVRQGHATVVTNTNLTVVNGETATLESARVIPYQTYDRIDGTAAPVLLVVEGDSSDPLHIPTTAPVPGSAAGRAELRDQLDVSEGFVLTFTPIIGQDSMVCRVECVINSLIGHTELDMPITSAYRTESMVGLVDGGTCLLGAFDKQTIMEVEDGIPVLRHIPYLGYLFSEVTEEVRTSKLVVILTPRINEHLTYTDEAVLNGRRIPGPSYDPYTSPPCLDCPPVFRDALRDGQNAIDDAMAENEAEWR